MASPDQSGDSKQDHSEDDDQTERQPTTSKADTLHPEQTSHNMNDLKTLDFNSADEIRQTMKAVLASKMPHEDPENSICLKTNVGVETNTLKKAEESAQSPSVVEAKQRTVKVEATENVSQVVNPKNEKAAPIRRKRPGRPPKAGTSKKIKRTSVTAMYLGKLSNVVPFKRRRYGSESESEDLDSVVILY